MSSHTPLIVVEVVLVFGGALLFGWWQLRSIRKDRDAAAAKRAKEARADDADAAPGH